MTEPTTETIRQAILEHTRRLAESAVAAEPGTVVPTTPEWTVADLVEHLGRTQNWVAEIVEGRVNDWAKLPEDAAVPPGDPGEWRTWLAESSQRLVGALSDDALEAPLLNAAADDRSGGRFWLDSSLNEAVIHGFDANNAAGRPTDIDPGIAAALIDNHLAMLTSSTWEQQRAESAHAIRGTGQTIQLVATDAGDDAAWLVERLPDGATWRPGRHPADVTVTGPAAALLLTLTRRLALADPETTGISVDGETGLVEHWLDSTAHVSG